MPSPSMKRFNHRRAEEPNNEPNVEIQLKTTIVEEVLVCEQVYHLVSWPRFALATSVVSRGKYGVDDDQGEICRDGEEHDHVEGPRDTANWVDSLKKNDGQEERSRRTYLDIRSSSTANPSNEATNQHHQLENPLLRLCIGLIAANNIAWPTCVSPSCVSRFRCLLNDLLEDSVGVLFYHSSVHHPTRIRRVKRRSISRMWIHS